MAWNSANAAPYHQPRWVCPCSMQGSAGSCLCYSRLGIHDGACRGGDGTVQRKRPGWELRGHEGAEWGLWPGKRLSLLESDQPHRHSAATIEKSNRNKIFKKWKNKNKKKRRKFLSCSNKFWRGIRFCSWQPGDQWGRGKKKRVTCDQSTFFFKKKSCFKNLVCVCVFPPQGVI